MTRRASEDGGGSRRAVGASTARRSIPLLLAVALVSAACGGNDESDLFAPIEEPGATTTAQPDSEVTTEVRPLDLDDVETDLDDDELRDVVAFYQAYLSLTDEALVAEPSQDLIDIVAPQLLTDLETARDDNAVLVGDVDLLGVERRRSFAHVVSVDGSADDLQLVDCVEREEVNPLGQTTIRYVTQTVTITTSEGRLRVDEAEVTNEGRLGGDFSCLPSDLLRRAETVAGIYLEETSLARAEPAETLPPDLEAVVGQPLRSQIEQALADQATIGVRLSTPEVHAYDAVGRDLSQAGMVVVVETCTHLPEGRAFVTATDGEPIELGAELEPDTAISANLLVELGPADGPGDQVIGFTDAESFSTCWEDRS